MAKKDIDLKLGLEAYREGTLALMRIIERHFPRDNSDVQQAKNCLLQALGHLKYVQMDAEERRVNGQSQTD